MRSGVVVPNGTERTFDVGELIVSKTDPRGVITYANDVFIRMSVYDEAAILGQPHNLIRHPDMPRAIFKLLWDTLKADQEIFAYINNLAKDGTHYWVLAHVTPSYDANGKHVGYHSNRRAPERDAVRAAENLYRTMRAAELRHSRPADAIAASTELFESRLEELGQTYDQFVWGMTREGAVA